MPVEHSNPVIKDLTDKIVSALKSQGFVIQRYDAYSTHSVYLKLDYGVCNRIRISNHNGKKKYKYKFNLIKQYKGPKQKIDKGYLRLYYDYNNTAELIEDVQKEKKAKIYKYGLQNYKSYMEQNSKDVLYKSFKNVA